MLKPSPIEPVPEATARPASECSPRGVKRETSGYKLRPRAPQPTARIDFAAVTIVMG
jgi:hypothetical protein